MLWRKGLLSEKRADRLKRWKHSGFHVYRGRTQAISYLQEEVAR